MNGGLKRVALTLVVAPAVFAQDPGSEPVSFQREIEPLLRVRCQGCHQPARAKAGLVLTDHAALLAGSLGGEVLVPGDPQASLLLEMVTPLDGEPPEMPKQGAPLDDDELALLRRWIAEGALDDTPPAAGPRYSHDDPPRYSRPPVVTSLAFSPDGELLAVSGRQEVLLYRADGSQLVARLVGLSERVETVAFSPDGTRLAVAAGTPARAGELQVWDVAERSLALSLPVTHETLRGASWSPDGTRVAFGCADNTLRAVDAASGEQILYQGAHGDWVLDTTWSLDGTHLVSVGRDRSMKLVLVASQQFIDNITSITPGALKGGLMSVMRHPTRDELLVGGADGTPRIYRMFRDKKRVIGDDYNLIRALEPMPGRVFAVAWSSDGERCAATSSQGNAGHARLYQVSDGATLWTSDLPAGAYAVAYHPGGETLAVAGADGVIRLLGAGDGSLRAELVAVPLEGDR